MATMENRNKLSGISRKYKKCIVCNKRRIPGSNVHLIRIPLDPDRCRLWIKAIGQEELVDLPIEKLHELKFVCNAHFQPEEFNESAKRLVKHAVPTLNLPLPPLPDELFKNFPLHIGQYPIQGITQDIQNISSIENQIMQTNKVEAMPQPQACIYLPSTSQYVDSSVNSREEKLLKKLKSQKITIRRLARSSLMIYCNVEWLSCKKHDIQQELFKKIAILFIRKHFKIINTKFIKEEETINDTYKKSQILSKA